MSHLLFTIVVLLIGWSMPFPVEDSWTNLNYRGLSAVGPVFELKNDQFGPFIIPPDKKTILQPLEGTWVDIRTRANELTKHERLKKRNSFQIPAGPVLNQVFADMERVFYPKTSHYQQESHFSSEQYFLEEEYDPATLSKYWNAARKNQDIVAGWMLHDRHLHDRHHWLCIDPFLWFFDANIVPNYQIWRTGAFDKSRPTNQLEEVDRTAWILEWLYLYDNGSSRFDSIRNWAHILWTVRRDTPRIKFR